MTERFEIIPVVDLMGGRAVRAAGGDRARYQPLVSPLVADASPLGAVKGLMSLGAFTYVYLADLDAIEGRQPQDAAIADIARGFPGVELWVDAGLADEAACRAWRARTEARAARIVLGSESLRDIGLPVRLDCVLSLDFRGGEFLGDPRLLADPRCWPRDVIVMTLDRVGAARGPDMTRLADIIARSDKRRGGRVYAAGGVRDDADLAALAALGASGALVSTALHSGAIVPVRR